MIRAVEALNYRCLRSVRQEVGPFQVLAGANASGKSTFLDVLRFLGTLVGEGLDRAVRERTDRLQDLIWQHSGDRFELAVEAALPQEFRQLPSHANYEKCRYEVAVGLDPAAGQHALQAERVLLFSPRAESLVQRELFPPEPQVRPTILTSSPVRGVKTVVNKVPGGNDNFYEEAGGGWDYAFKLGAGRSALGNIPDDPSRFPVASWLKRLLSEQVVTLTLNHRLLRQPTPPGVPKSLLPVDSNLPWAIDELQKNPESFAHWIAQVRTALPDLRTVEVVERPEDKHRYLVVVHENGLRMPAWGLSAGTLRLLALTLLANLNEPNRVYLIEELEHGLHPRSVETVFRALSSSRGSQFLCATHSPVVLSLADPGQLLCFTRTSSGAAEIVRGTEHPNLGDWRRAAS